MQEVHEMQEKEVRAQGEREEEQRRTQGVEKKSRTCEDKDVSSRHMRWWRTARWIRIEDGSSMRSARGRRRVRRAAKSLDRLAMETGSQRPNVKPNRPRVRNGEEKGERKTDKTMQ